MNIIDMLEDPISKLIFILTIIVATSIIVRLVAYLMNKKHSSSNSLLQSALHSQDI